MTDTESAGRLRSRGANPEAFRYYVRLARVEAWLNEHYSDDVSLGAAARIVGLNPRYFSKFFHDKTGVHFSKWVRSVRTERAMQRMRDSNCSITTVAFEVGFKDLRTFERVFKKHVGMTPRDYRDRVRPESSPITRVLRCQPFRSSNA